MDPLLLDVSVIIGTYSQDRWDDLAAVVESVQRQTIPVREIIVVVDHNEKLLERVRVELPSVIATGNTQSAGLGGTRNSGLALAQGAIYAFLDDDAIAAPDWVEQMIAAYDGPDVLGVGGAIEVLSSAGRAEWFPAEFNWVVGCTYRGMPETTAAVRNLFGCNMSFRRQVFEAIGGFRLGYGCDETEFCIRVGRRWPQGLLIYKPEVRVLHRVPRSRMSWPYFVSRCYFEGGSKAVVTWLAGSKDGLASERAYTFRTLPRGVVRGLADAMIRRDKAGLTRAGAIVAGLAVTTAGYLVGKTSTLEAARRRGWSNQVEPAG
jgi:glucosyl-dolichyl phosphate glucuronosyltransferase